MNDARPGGWVEGIGWIAVADPVALDGCTVRFNVNTAEDAVVTMEYGLPAWLSGRLVVVVAWPDGSKPESPVRCACNPDPIAAVNA